MKDRKLTRATYAEAETTANAASEENDYAAREKKVRNSRLTWAQNRIQNAYQHYGLTDDFLWAPLHWYLTFQAASRLSTFHEIPSSLLPSINALTDRLGAIEQDRLNVFHLQLAADPTRGLKAKWKDIGIPIYHWINNAFKREWGNLTASVGKNKATFVSISTVPNVEDDDPASIQNVIDGEISLGDYIEAPAAWFAENDPGAERERQERALVWNSDLQAYVRANEIWLHPGHAIGKPIWVAVRAIRQESEFNSVIVDSIIELGRVDYSKITRKLNAAGFDVKHDKVNRIVKKIETMLATVRDSEENHKSKHNTHAKYLPAIPKIEIPEAERRLREKRDTEQVTWEGRLAANKKWHRTTFLRGTSIPVVTMPADEFDALIGNRLVFAIGDNGVKAL